jgi:F-type H+-transporting ATPase subunit delta
MARRTAAARRYAEAVFELASRDGAHDAWEKDLGVLAEITGDERVADVLGNPSIPGPERQKLVNGLFAGRVSPKAVNLALLLADRGRVELLPGIAREYRGLLNRARGIVEAEVTSAAPLTSEETEALRRRIESMAGARIDLRTQVDERLIGGLTVKVAGRLLDASVRGRLERLRSDLIAGTRAR